MLPTPWISPDDVYEPREDSFLLASAIADAALDGKTVLDMGTGTGIQAFVAARAGAHVTAVDINPSALTAARENLARHLPGADVTFIVSDLFEQVDNVYNAIMFNPPYVPGGAELGTMEERAWTGGEQGREVIDRFLDGVRAHLMTAGSVFLLQSSLNDVEQTMEWFQDQEFTASIVAEQKVAWERLVVIRADAN